MDLNNGGFSGLGSGFEGEVRTIALPSWSKPCFAIPLVTFGPVSNATYIQNVDVLDRVIGVSLFEPPDDAIQTLKVGIGGVRRDSLQIHAVVGPNGEAHAGLREDLSDIVAPWLTAIPWPLTRLAFADFAGDEDCALAAADAALKDKIERQGAREAAVWFVNAVVFRRIQRSALQAAATVDRSTEVEMALDQLVMDVNETEIIARLPPVLAEVLDGLNADGAPSLAMALKLARLVAPNGLSFANTSAAPKLAAMKRTVPPSGGEYSDLWLELYNNIDDPSWLARWRDAWTASDAHEDFETLAAIWLAVHEDAPIASQGGLMLFTLLNPNRPQISPRTLDAAEAWLRNFSWQTTKWPKVWARLAALKAPAPITMKLGLTLLEEALDRGGVTNNDWLRLWRALKRLQPDNHQHLDHLAIQALYKFGNQPKFARRTAIQLFSSELTEKLRNNLWAWLLDPPRRGNGWVDFYLHVFNAHPDDEMLVGLGLDWLEGAETTLRRWSPVWLALYRSIGPNERLLRAGAGYVMALPANYRTQDPVWKVLNLSSHPKVQTLLNELPSFLDHDQGPSPDDQGDTNV